MTWKMCMASLACRNARAYLPRRCRQMPMARSVLPSSAYVYVSMYRYCSICMHMPMARTNSMCKRTLFPWYIAKRCAFSYICCARYFGRAAVEFQSVPICMHVCIYHLYICLKVCKYMPSSRRAPTCTVDVSMNTHTHARTHTHTHTQSST